MKEILQKEAYLQSLKNGSTRVEAAEKAETCTTTVWNWRQRDDEFKKAEQAALEDRIAIVEDALYKNASGGETKDNDGKKISRRGNIIAQIFWLKNRGKGKWKEKSEVDVNEIKTIKVKAFIQAGEEPVIEEEEDPEKEINENNEENPREEIETVL